MVADESLSSSRPRISNSSNGASLLPRSQLLENVYVLDTSVLVHDPGALHAFRDATIGIPIYVIMELDDLKNSKRYEVAASARLASRMISELRQFGHLSAEEGVYHPELNSSFHIVSNGPVRPSELEKSTSRRSMDMLILASASLMAASGKYGKVSLISKDVNLRVLADIEGLIAEDYEPDRVAFSDLYTGYRIVEEFEPAVMAAAFTPEEILRPEALDLEDLAPNEFVVLRDGKNEVLLRYDDSEHELCTVPREFGRLGAVQARNVEQRMALSLLMDPDVELVTMIGKAGTGKTFLALACALAQLRHGHGGRGYDRILLSKPVVAMGQDIGYLPGDLEAKMQPWMNSFFDNLDQLIPSGNEAASKGASRSTKGWEYLFQTGELEIQPLHSIRGRSIPAAFMFIDEAQNLTPHEVKTVITRAANGTKVVLSGDPYQVDNHFLDQHSNGLVHVTERVRDSRFTGTVFFTRGERSRLSELAATRL